MGKLTLREEIVRFIGHIGWKMFCWSYRGGEDQYFDDMYEDVLRRAESDGEIVRL